MVLHGIAGVHHEIECNLLELNPVAEHLREVGFQVDAERDVLRQQVGSKDLGDLGYCGVQVDIRMPRRVPLQHRAHPDDHVGGALALGDDVGECATQFLQARREANEALGGLGVRSNRGERLTNLVRQRAGERRKCGDAADVGQLLSQLNGLELGPLPLRDVPDKAQYFVLVAAYGARLVVARAVLPGYRGTRGSLVHPSALPDGTDV